MQVLVVILMTDLLRKPTHNLTEEIEPIIEVFRNGAIAEQTRERLDTIEKLSKASSI